VLAETVFFSFAEVIDPRRHRDYNEWHQLDHRPENLALDGIRHGERWVRTPACAQASVVGDPRLAGTHYVNMYWFRSPVERSFREWQALAERSYQWGRRPELEYTSRGMMGLFSTVKSYASPRVLVSPDAVPFRPARGVLLSLRRFEAHSKEAHRYFAVYDHDYAPTVLATTGVVGIWTFSSVSTTIDPSWRPVPGSTTFDPSGRDAGTLRAELVFVDEDPLTVQQALPRHEGGEEIFTSALLPIRAWHWDWFDA
jgi:hypothetical protein